MEETLNTSTETLNNVPVPPRPDDHLMLAILTTICCCLPFGLVGIIKASQVSKLYLMRQYDAAQVVADQAKKWSMLALWCGIAIYTINIIVSIIGIATD